MEDIKVEDLLYNINSAYDVLKSRARDAKKRIEQRERITKSNNFLVTINPKDDIPIDIFVAKVKKIVEWKWVELWMYTFEQRSEEPNVYHGIHCHIYIQGTRAKCQVHSQIFSLFRDYVGNSKHVDVRQLKRPNDIDKALEYIKGNKSSEKQGKCDNDVEFRLHYELEPIYTNMQ